MEWTEQRFLTSRLIMTKLCASSEISLDSANLGFSAEEKASNQQINGHHDLWLTYNHTFFTICADSQNGAIVTRDTCLLSYHDRCKIYAATKKCSIPPITQRCDNMWVWSGTHFSLERILQTVWVGELFWSFWVTLTLKSYQSSQSKLVKLLFGN